MRRFTLGRRRRQCSKCGRLYTLRADGTVRKHEVAVDLVPGRVTRHDVCAGSGLAPLAPPASVE